MHNSVIKQDRTNWSSNAKEGKKWTKIINIKYKKKGSRIKKKQLAHTVIVNMWMLNGQYDAFSVTGIKYHKLYLWLICSYRSIILSLAPFNLRLSKSRSRIAAFISSSSIETLAHASSRAACYPTARENLSLKSKELCTQVLL